MYGLVSFRCVGQPFSVFRCRQLMVRFSLVFLLYSLRSNVKTLERLTQDVVFNV